MCVAASDTSDRLASSRLSSFACHLARNDPRRPTALGASKNSKCPAPSNVSISLVEISDVQTFACSTGVMRSLVPHRIRVGTLIHFSHRLSFGSYSLSQTIRASDVNSRYRPTLMSTVKSVLGIRANASGDETMYDGTCSARIVNISAVGCSATRRPAGHASARRRVVRSTEARVYRYDEPSEPRQRKKILKAAGRAGSMEIDYWLPPPRLEDFDANSIDHDSALGKSRHLRSSLFGCDLERRRCEFPDAGNHLFGE